MPPIDGRNLGSTYKSIPSAPSRFYRSICFFALLLFTFGAHAGKSGLSVLQVFFVNDLWITSGGYGILLASSTLPGAFLPFIAGHLFDEGDQRTVSLLLLMTCALGQILFAIAVQLRIFWFACFAQVIIF